MTQDESFRTKPIFNSLDYLEDYWSLFGPIPPCDEPKIIKIALLFNNSELKNAGD